MGRDEVSLLKAAFESFTSAVDKLSKAYSELEKEVARLRRELARENAEKEKLRNYLVSILNSIDLGIVALDKEGKVIVFNRAASRFFGGKPEEVLGKEGREVLGEGSPLLATLADGSPKHLADVTICPSGGEPIQVEISTAPVRDEEGKVIGAVQIVEDVTERKRLEEQMRRSETLSALGEMAVQVAHEIRNPLGAIQLFVGILQRELTGDLKKLADDIASGLRSIEVITSNLLSIARPIKPSLQEADIGQLLDEAISFTIYAIEENGIKLIREYPPRGLKCWVDPERMKQVFLNLILNAIQAMPEGGELRISAAKRGEWIRLEIEDTGCGIPKEHLDKIFNPFFSTKRSGTGLGLYTVDKILRAHGASISVRSEVGVGTCFTIELPSRGGETG